jgi:hypothetical protein
MKSHSISKLWNLEGLRICIRLTFSTLDVGILNADCKKMCSLYVCVYLCIILVLYETVMEDWLLGEKYKYFMIFVPLMGVLVSKITL